MSRSHVLGQAIGSGEMYFRPKGQNGWSALGNSQEATIAIETETVEVPDRRVSDRPTLKRFVTSTTRTVELTLDAMTMENIARYLSGQVTDVTQDSTPIVDEPHTVEQDTYIQLGETPANPNGARNVTGIVVTDVGGGTTHVEDVDYSVLDLELAIIYIIPGGGIASGGPEGIEVDYTPAAETRQRTSTSASAELNGSLKYVSNSTGEDKDYLFADVDLTSTGALGLVTDEEQTMQYSIGVNQPATGDAITVDGRAIA